MYTFSPRGVPTDCLAAEKAPTEDFPSGFDIINTLSSNLPYLGCDVYHWRNYGHVNLLDASRKSLFLASSNMTPRAELLASRADGDLNIANVKILLVKTQAHRV